MNPLLFIPIRPKLFKILIPLLLIALLVVAACDPSTPSTSSAESRFTLEILDSHGPRAPWGKTLGDINGNGLLDVVVGGHQPRRLSLGERLLRKVGLFDRTGAGGELVWYENPTWQRHSITENYKVRTDIEVADINADGHNDIVLVADQGVIWLKGPEWAPKRISPLLLHDLEVTDLDLDGDLDLVGRNQSLFGHHDGHLVHILRQDDGQRFSHIHIPSVHGEGLAVADMDRDGYPDIVVNQQWLKNPGTVSNDIDWNTRDYAGDWSWPDVFIDVADINRDGRPDIVLSPAEQAGQYYRLSWFEAPSDPDGTWREEVVDARVEAAHHFVAALDIDGTGDLDIVTAEMNQGEGDNPVKLYMKSEEGWRRNRISELSSHSMRAADIDNDFDIDLMGTNWQFEDDKDYEYPVYLWRNQSSSRIGWRRHLIDDSRPGQATFILAADLNGDGATDLASGGHWYRQPESLGSTWTRTPFGDPAANVALLKDFDDDGDVDVLASGWRGYNQQPGLLRRLLNRLGIREYDYEQSGDQLAWAENDGQGRFELHTNIEPASGDFLQGIDWATGIQGGPQAILSWHRQNEGLQALSVPVEPTHSIWRWRRISDFSQDEAITVIDLDGDESPEIVTGTAWLARSNSGWETHWISRTRERPDRHRLVDLNNDGRLDIVVGFESASRAGKLVWYEQPEDLYEPWLEHPLPTLTGPMSLGIGDIDLDGDIDIIVGEHDLDQPDQARLVWLENRNGMGSDWRPHLIHRGDEHHDGALVVDLDGDGDLDIASIGWSHGKVLVYENLIR
ncbi:FG-GAP repeat domain-containing protein [Saccharospirillum salsuginis]|nr:VCBS repeat-containing protein [Saccharospirillum salsuginis]